jgi:hypothetical protein
LALRHWHDVQTKLGIKDQGLLLANFEGEGCLVLIFVLAAGEK